MELIKRVPYESIEFLFVSYHYDIHRKGVGYYKDRLCFIEAYEDWDNTYKDPDGDEWPTLYCDLYKLNLFGRLRWMIKKRLFEFFVSSNWSSDKPGTKLKNKRLRSFYYRMKINKL